MRKLVLLIALISVLSGCGDIMHGLTEYEWSEIMQTLPSGSSASIISDGYIDNHRYFVIRYTSGEEHAHMYKIVVSYDYGMREYSGSGKRGIVEAAIEKKKAADRRGFKVISWILGPPLLIFLLAIEIDSSSGIRAARRKMAEKRRMEAKRKMEIKEDDQWDIMKN